MACIAETLGMALPGSAAIPAVHSARLVVAEASRTGRHGNGGKNRFCRAQIITEKVGRPIALRVLMAVGRLDQCGDPSHGYLPGGRGSRFSYDWLNEIF